jgi:hypothetical protein
MHKKKVLGMSHEKKNDQGKKKESILWEFFWDVNF